jgi:hypothetical protein
VFHASQIDGVPALAPPVTAKKVVERIEDAETILAASGAPPSGISKSRLNEKSIAQRAMASDTPRTTRQQMCNPGNSSSRNP